MAGAVLGPGLEHGYRPGYGPVLVAQSPGLMAGCKPTRRPAAQTGGQVAALAAARGVRPPGGLDRDPMELHPASVPGPHDNDAQTRGRGGRAPARSSRVAWCLTCGNVRMSGGRMARSGAAGPCERSEKLARARVCVRAPARALLSLPTAGSPRLGAVPGAIPPIGRVEIRCGGGHLALVAVVHGMSRTVEWQCVSRAVSSCWGVRESLPWLGKARNDVALPPSPNLRPIVVAPLQVSQRGPSLTKPHNGRR